MKDLDKRLTIINEGQKAKVVLAELAPYLEKLRKETSQLVTHTLMAGELSLEKSLAYKERLSTLNDIENHFKSKVTSFERIAKEGNDDRTDN